MRARPGCLVFAAALAGIAPLVSFAPEAEAQEARRLFLEGLDALRAGDFDAATRALPRSYDLEPLPATICNLALAYDRWPGHEELAADTYARCAREDRSGLFRQNALEREREIRATLPRSPAPEPRQAPTPIPITTPGPATGPDPAPTTVPPPLPPPSLQGVVVPPTSPPQRAPESRSHGLLYAGLTSGALSVAAFLGGLAFVEGARSDAEALDERYDGGQAPIPRGSSDADLLEGASRRSDMGVGLYITAGALAAVAVVLVVLDATQSPERETR